MKRQRAADVESKEPSYGFSKLRPSVPLWSALLGIAVVAFAGGCAERNAKSPKRMGVKVPGVPTSSPAKSTPTPLDGPAPTPASPEEANSLVVNDEPNAGSTANSPQSAAAFQMLTTSCGTCHPDFPTFTSDAQWTQEGYVVAGKPEESKIMKRLRFSDVGAAEFHDMPRSGEWKTENTSQIKSWIVSLAQAAESPDSKRRKEALGVIEKRCKSCHAKPQTAKTERYVGATVAAFAGYSTDNAFVNAGLVFPKDVGQSWLYQAIKGIGTLQGIHLGGDIPIVFDDEASFLRAWIDSM